MKFDKNVPLPTLRKEYEKFAGMEIGDSFFGNAYEANYCRNVAKKNGWKVTSRATLEGGQKGFRVWRVE